MSRLPTDITELPPLYEWADDETIKRHFHIFNGGTMQGVLDVVNIPLLIINKYRQVVFLNKRLRALLGDKPLELMIGKRPGDLFGCSSAMVTAGGCGTAEACAFCGARASALAALAGREASEESRVLCHDTDTGRTAAYDLLVSSKPLHKEGELFAIITLQDISDQKRRRTLERIFFHDVLNTAGNLIGLAEIMVSRNKGVMDEELSLFNTAAAQIVDEIQSQRLLMDAESRELKINLEALTSLQLLKSMRQTFSKQKPARNRFIEIDPKAEDVPFFSDRTLLKRVLGNMLKNALEAARSGDTVTLSCKSVDEGPLLMISNPGVIRQENRSQIFMRHFSTKGAGRGLGTYSIKLLGEDYLGGKVWFESSRERGTTFFLKLPPAISPEP